MSDRRVVQASVATAPQSLHMQAPNPLLVGPILPTLLHLSLPNMISMLATTVVAIVETIYVGALGTPALAGMALVFPMVMLQQMMSAGAMGGGISSAISRALGAGDEARAQALALHATVIGGVAGLLFMLLFLGLGGAIYASLGGRGPALAEALVYSNVVFLGALGIWLCNTFASVLRGGGNMKLPSATLIVVAGVQIVLGGGLGLGIGPLPKLGMVGVGLGQAVAYTGGAIFFFTQLRADSARVKLRFAGQQLDGAMFRDILKVGALACVSPLQSVLTVLILTRLVAHFGTEALAGYGIGARLEFLLIPITFAIGVACVPMVGMAIGAGLVARARRVAWTGGALAGAIIGAVGLVFVVAPQLWAERFSTDPAVLAAAQSYLVASGLGYGFFGLGMALYFSSQGAGKVLGPVLAGTSRLFVIVLGGWYLAVTDSPAWTMFALVGMGMAVYGIATAGAVYVTRWGRT